MGHRRRASLKERHAFCPAAGHPGPARRLGVARGRGGRADPLRPRRVADPLGEVFRLPWARRGGAAGRPAARPGGCSEGRPRFGIGDRARPARREPRARADHEPGSGCRHAPWRLPQAALRGTGGSRTPLDRRGRGLGPPLVVRAGDETGGAGLRGDSRGQFADRRLRGRAAGRARPGAPAHG